MKQHLEGASACGKLCLTMSPFCWSQLKPLSRYEHCLFNIFHSCAQESWWWKHAFEIIRVDELSDLHGARGWGLELLCWISVATLWSGFSVWAKCYHAHYLEFFFLHLICRLVRKSQRESPHLTQHQSTHLQVELSSRRCTFLSEHFYFFQPPKFLPLW